METNFFGALWLTQAALPIMRAQKSGRILQVSSIGGITTFPMLGMYHASKWALEAFSETLSRETKDLGIKVTLIEPKGYETDWAGSSSVHSQLKPEYSNIRVDNQGRVRLGKRGNPNATAEAIFKIVDAENPPLRLFLGSDILDLVKDRYDERMSEWEAWQEVSAAAQGN